MDASEEGRMDQSCRLGRWPSSTPSSINTIVFPRHSHTRLRARTGQQIAHSELWRGLFTMLGNSR